MFGDGPAFMEVNRLTGELKRIKKEYLVTKTIVLIQLSSLRPRLMKRARGLRTWKSINLVATYHILMM
jgi:hypothetical protein